MEIGTVFILHLYSNDWAPSLVLEREAQSEYRRSKLNTIIYNIKYNNYNKGLVDQPGSGLGGELGIKLCKILLNLHHFRTRREDAAGLDVPVLRNPCMQTTSKLQNKPFPVLLAFYVWGKLSNTR